MARCHCCSGIPLDQHGEVQCFRSNRDILSWMEEFRNMPGNSKKPILSMMWCGRGETMKFGGTGCREEGGCHHSEQQCLLYYATAPFYQVMLPFLIPNKKIHENIVKLKKMEEKVKKSAKKETPKAVLEREEFEFHLDLPFRIVDSNYKALIKACPLR